MLYELNYDMHRAAMLTEKLAERNARLTETLEQLELSAAAANVGMWSRPVNGTTLWLSQKASEILGFPSGEQFTRDNFYQQIHPDDRDVLATLIRELKQGKNEFQLEIFNCVEGC